MAIKATMPEDVTGVVKRAAGAELSVAEDETYLVAVGETVRRARSGRGMTRKALALASGVSERYLADMETGSGNASLLVLRKIARAMGLEVGDLVREGTGPSLALARVTHQLETLTDEQLGEVSAYVQARHGTLRLPQREHVALIGLRGAGKTTLGRALAERRGVPFVELDREIERVAGMEIAEIFALQGQSGFRKLERECLAAVIDQFSAAVIATGGSLVTSPKTFELLLSKCVVIWLKADPSEHMERVLAQGDMRPMADNPQAMDDLKSILDSRAALYARADVTLDTSGLTVDMAMVELDDLVAAQGKARRKP